MANVSKIRGFVPVASVSGSSWQGMVRMFAIGSGNATALFRGDAVKLVAADGGGTQGIASYGSIEPAAAVDTILGVFLGPFVNRAIAQTEAPGYIPAATAAFGLVCVGQDVIYEVQDDAAAAFTASDIGKVGNHVATAGSVTTGVSQHTLNTVDTQANTTNHGWLLMALSPRPNNAYGINGKYEVRINRSAWKIPQ